ncbi:MAG: hypothetical protein ABSC16_06080 [Candidatus Dormibacteria bacterium]|jgi:hypothetical protein|nr:hypothetical protein [Chloroflexota bacterium]HBV93698.1 hypothetical protein [Chloroflexota bacterium]
MPAISVRWSEQEARKPYARPFMVSFADDAGEVIGSVAVSGADLLYYRQFQAAVLALAGELFVDGALDAEPDAQAAWLERLSALLPAVESLELRPVSTFDHDRGRVFHVEARVPGCPDPARVEAPAVLEYQELQATLAHQTGRLYRNRDIEAVVDPDQRQRAWLRLLGDLLERPGADEAMAGAWPWRPRPAP